MVKNITLILRKLTSQLSLQRIFSFCKKAMPFGPAKKTSALIVLTLIAVVFSTIVVVSNDRPALAATNIKLDDIAEPMTVDNSVLQVVQASPQNSLSLGDDKKEVIVMFNHAMVAMARLNPNAHETKGVFTIRPRVHGKFRWYGSRICAFIADKQWQPGKNYSISVSTSIQSLNGKRLQKEYRFQFKIKVPNLRLYSINPRSGRIKYRQKFDLYFNFPVALSQVKKSLRLTADAKNIRFSAEYRPVSKRSSTVSYDSDSDSYYVLNRKYRRKKHVIIKNLTPFAKNSKILLTIKPDLKAAFLSSRLQKKVEKQFKSYGDFTVKLERATKVKRFYDNLWRYGIVFSNPVKKETAMKAIQFSPQAENYSESGGETLQLALTNWALDAGKNYTIKISPFEDVMGNTITRNTSFEISIPSHRPYFDTDTGIYAIESKMRQSFPVVSVNMTNIKVKTAKFTIEHLRSRMLKPWKYKIFDHVSAIESIYRPDTKVDIISKTGYDLSPLLDENKNGWLAIELSAGTPNYNNKTHVKTLTQLIQSTDLGITAKESIFASHIWLHSLTAGKALANVKVTAYAKVEKLASCTTNNKGYCKIKKDKPNLHNRILFVAEKDSDRAFLVDDSHEVYMYSVSENFSSQAALPYLNGQIIFDRKLYRPGDKVSIKALLTIKENGKLISLNDRAVQVRVNNAHGKKIFSKVMKTSNKGGVWFSINTKKEDPLGHYNVSISIKNMKGYLADTFQVEEFRAATFTVKTKAVSKSIAAKTENIIFSAKYLFGAAMQNAPIRYHLSRDYYSVHFANFPDYTFGDDTSNDSEKKQFRSGSGKLNRKGEFAIKLKLPEQIKELTIDQPQKIIKLSQSYILSTEATVKDIDEKSVSNRSQIKVMAGSFHLGIHTLNRFQSKQKPFTFKVIAVDKKGIALSNKKVNIYIIKKEYRSIKTKGPAGSIQVRNTLFKKLIKSTSILLKKATSYTFSVAESGDYSIIVQSKKYRNYAATSFYAYGGKEFYSWASNDDDRVTLSSDKKLYQPGDTAKIIIQSPFEKATAIISLEREGVLWQKVTDITGNGIPVEIKIKKDYLPNVYVSVVLLRPRMKASQNASKEEKKYFLKEDLGLPQFKIGVIKLNIDNSSKRAKLTIATDKESYAPGEKVTIRLTSEPRAEIALSVADRGVLDLINYFYSDPINRLYNNWPHSVRMFDLRRKLIRQYQYGRKGKNPGGGGGNEGGGGFSLDSEDGERKNFKYTAYWKPNIVTDNSGEATVTFILPHNLTTFRILALASSGTQFQTASKEFTVKKLLVIQPLLPRFIRTGDALKIGAVLINQTSVAARFKLEILSDMLTITSSSATIKLQSGEAKEISFASKVNLAKYSLAKNKNQKNNSVTKFGTIGQIDAIVKIRATGLSKVAFKKASISLKDVTDVVRIKLPIKEQLNQEAFTIAGVTENKANESLVIPEKKELHQDQGGLTITASSSALIGLKEGYTFYQSNPYLCLEQRASAYLLSLTSGKLLNTFGFDAPSKSGYQFSQIEKLFVGDMKYFQNSDGGFKLWKSSYRSDPYLTAYVVQVAQIAVEHGHQIDRKNIDRALIYLQKYLKNPGRRAYSYSLETIALIQYLLAKEKINVKEIQQNLIENISRLSMRAQGYLLLGLKTSGNHTSALTELLTHINNRIEVTTRKVSFKKEKDGSYERAFYAAGASLGVIIRAFIVVQPRHPLIEKMISYAISDSGRRLWRDSHSTGMLALALYSYHKKYESNFTNKQFRFLVKLGNQNIFDTTLRGNSLAVSETKFSMTKLFAFPEKSHQPFLFQLKDTGRVYYTATLEYYPKFKIAKSRDEGIEISRFISKLPKGRNQKPVLVSGTLKRGELYLRTIRVSNIKPYFNALIVDPLAANVEVVNTSFSTEKTVSLSVLSKARKSRQRYWWQRDEHRVEYRDDKVIITEGYLSAGLHEYFYLIRATTKGRATAPAANSKIMYEPEIFGRSSQNYQLVR